MSFEPDGGINFDNRIEMQDELAEISAGKSIWWKRSIRNLFGAIYFDDSEVVMPLR